MLIFEVLFFFSSIAASLSVAWLNVQTTSSIPGRCDNAIASSTIDSSFFVAFGYNSEYLSVNSSSFFEILFSRRKDIRAVSEATFGDSSWVAAAAFHWFQWSLLRKKHGQKFLQWYAVSQRASSRLSSTAPLEACFTNLSPNNSSTLADIPETCILTNCWRTVSSRVKWVLEWLCRAVYLSASLVFLGLGSTYSDLLDSIIVHMKWCIEISPPTGTIAYVVFFIQVTGRFASHLARGWIAPRRRPRFRAWASTFFSLKFTYVVVFVISPFLCIAAQRKLRRYFSEVFQKMWVNRATSKSIVIWAFHPKVTKTN